MRRTRVRTSLLCAVLVGALAVGAPAPAIAGSPGPRVVASFFPLEWVVETVGGGRVEVIGLTPAGAEPHDLEVTIDDRAAIGDADLVITLGGGFQPTVDEASEQRDGPTLDVRRVLSRSERRRAARDPHVWLDPVVMRRIVASTARRLAALDPSQQDAYQRRADALDADLLALDADFRSGLAHCERDLVVTAHEAFGWLAARYGIRQRGVAGIDPEQEPTPERLAQLSDLVRDRGVTTIFTEALVSPKVAETLAAEAGGLRTAVLHPLESLSDDDQAQGADYLSVMRDNLDRIRVALGCV